MKARLPRLPGPSGRILLTLLALAPAAASAVHPLATDDAGTVGAGAAEVELSFAGEQAAVEGLGLSTGLALHAGILETLDLGIGLGYAWSGAMDDPVLDLKWRALEGEGLLPALALRLDLRVGQGGTAGEGHGLGAHAVLTWERARWLVSLCAGTALDGLGQQSAATPSLEGGGMLLLPAGEGLQLGAETVVALPGAGEPVGLDLMAAGLLELGERHLLSLGVGVHLEQAASPGWVGTLGFTTAFGG
ncbi:MAG: hypothetical protein P1V51_20680 [Deltaproteobacteria bacterium]|nr:hypothetical protein [Deltaproteobacteria bacterium]